MTKHTIITRSNQLATQKYYYISQIKVCINFLLIVVKTIVFFTTLVRMTWEASWLHFQESNANEKTLLIYSSNSTGYCCWNLRSMNDSKVSTRSWTKYFISSATDGDTKRIPLGVRLSTRKIVHTLSLTVSHKQCQQLLPLRMNCSCRTQQKLDWAMGCDPYLIALL